MSEEREVLPDTRSIWRVAGRAAALAAGAAASTELLASESGRLGLSIAVAVALTAAPAVALLAAIRGWTGWAPVLSFMTWVAAGAAVLVATSVPPLARVEGAQTAGLAAVATVLLVVPVIRGGYNPRGLADTRSLGPMVDRIDPDR